MGCKYSWIAQVGRCCVDGLPIGLCVLSCCWDQLARCGLFTQVCISNLCNLSSMAFGFEYAQFRGRGIVMPPLFSCCCRARYLECMPTHSITIGITIYSYVGIHCLPKPSTQHICMVEAQRLGPGRSAAMHSACGDIPATRESNLSHHRAPL